MEIGGLQKMTLLDYPGKVACTVFLSGCNFRCPYCHNSALVLPGRMGSGISQEELLEFLDRRKGKLDGVCITGGEPTVHRDLPELIEKIRQKGFLVKLDTNGSNPSMLEALIREKKIDYVAMDVKNSPERYGWTCGNSGILEGVQESVEILKQDAIDYEFRTTVCKPFHDAESMASLARWIQGCRRYFIQNFEDSGSLVGEGAEAFSQQELQELFRAVRVYIPEARIRGQQV